MNRIKLADQIKLVERELQLDSPDNNSLRTEEIQHSLFVPLHYERNYDYPLVVWLHENGAGHRQVSRIMPRISMRNYLAIAPGIGDAGVGNSETNHSFKITSDANADWGQDRDSILDAETAVARCISIACENYSVDTNRIFIAGSGAGGTMAYRIGLNHPDWFAGVLSFGGAMPVDQNPLADFKRCRKLPCFVAQARECTEFDVNTLCSQLRLMYSAGFDVTVRQYPEGEQLSDQILHDMNVWMMELVTGQKHPETPSPSSKPISGNN